MAPVKSSVKQSQSDKPKRPMPMPAVNLLGAGKATPVESLESVVLTALKTTRPRRQVNAKQAAQVHERTVRMRRQGEPDRRFYLAYTIDPNDSDAVIFRVRPVSDLELGPTRASMLSTQQAADQLNVSRPYVVKLVDDGVFQGVERTQAGHRRIPAAEVERVRQDMRVSRRAALKRVDALTSDLRAQELDAAHKAAKRRWAKIA